MEMKPPVGSGPAGCADLKNRAFARRLGFALAGIASALRSEASLRTQLAAASGAVASLVWLAAPPVWVALVILVCGCVLATELFNTALERTLDGLHPGRAEFVRDAKDIAAGAVLVLSLAALAIYGVMLWALLPH